MKMISKCLINDKDGNFLVLELNKHPDFGNDADLPGGTVDPGETIVQAAAREANEEAGIDIHPDDLTLLYEGDEYSYHDSFYTLYGYEFDVRPTVSLSWEHASYEWVSKNELIKRGNAAKDTYMHMVAAVAAQLGS